MRLRRSRIKTFYHKKAVIQKDKEGSVYMEYGEAIPFQGETWPASGKGKMQVEMYGIRLPYIQNIKVDGRYTIGKDEKGANHYLFENGLSLVEGDGICLNSPPEDGPDYTILSITPYKHLQLEVERIDHRT